MTLTYKEATLTEIRDILLRIERILTREADDSTVRFYQRLLEKQAKERAPDHTRWVPPLVPGMPEPPLPRVQTTWKGSLGEALLDSPAPRTFMHGGWIHASGFSMVGP